MSYHKNPEITCDHGGRNTFSCGANYYGTPLATVAEMRAELRRDGWRFRDGLDFCPAHALPDTDAARDPS